jgi:hypothetical protein
MKKLKEKFQEIKSEIQNMDKVDAEVFKNH